MLICTHIPTHIHTLDFNKCMNHIASHSQCHNRLPVQLLQHSINRRPPMSGPDKGVDAAAPRSRTAQPHRAAAPRSRSEAGRKLSL